MPTILIVGGYGAVGRHIAKNLSSTPANHVIIAGRNLARARATGFDARRIDIGDPTTWDAALAGVDLVITCIDQQNTSFLQACCKQNAAVLDVTAVDAFFRQVEALTLSTPILLSVGLAPGLSNLLAKAASTEMDQVDSIEIGLLMGTGDDHGSAAIAWSTAQMFDPHAKIDDAMVDFGPDFGPRKAHYMDFADQHVLARTMPGIRTVTRVTYDSKPLSALLFWLGRRFAGNSAMERFVNRISNLPTFGSDKCVLSVTAKGSKNGAGVTQTALFRGRREAAVTAAVASLMAQDLLSGAIPPGIHHSHQVIDPTRIFEALEQLGHGTVSFS